MWLWARQMGGAAFLVVLWLSYRAQYAGSPLRDRRHGVFEFMPIVYRALAFVGLPIAAILTILGTISLLREVW